jgi:endonuclease/exonuclease/phosphatase family metal-dependent hydrolase
MKKSLHIFSLNIEYGKYSETLIPYIAKISKDIDVFCLQEVPRDARDTTVFEPEYDAHFYEKLVAVLPDFTPYYSEFVKESFGIATFVRSSLKQKDRGEAYIF